uniref:Uncharacterized protein n=1 Tax=Timema bartmani TaxID=61472 RepID=A0A7R9F5X2_9NEOP|nr:unnamed protein product [Timema bartmani]
MVVIPVYGDQPVNAGAVAAAGMALRLDYHTLTKKRLLELLHAVLNNTNGGSITPQWSSPISINSKWVTLGCNNYLGAHAFWALGSCASLLWLVSSPTPPAVHGCRIHTVLHSQDLIVSYHRVGDHPEDLADVMPGVVVAQTTTGVTVSLTTVSSTASTIQPPVHTIGSLMDTLVGTMWGEFVSAPTAHTDVVVSPISHPSCVPSVTTTVLPVVSSVAPNSFAPFTLYYPPEWGLQVTLEGEKSTSKKRTAGPFGASASDQSHTSSLVERGEVSESDSQGSFELQRPRLPKKTNKWKKVGSPPLSPSSPDQQGKKGHLMTTSSIVSTGEGVQIAASDGSLPPGIYDPSRPPFTKKKLPWLALHPHRDPLRVLPPCMKRWMVVPSRLSRVRPPPARLPGPAVDPIFCQGTKRGPRAYVPFIVGNVGGSPNLSKETSLNHFKITMESYRRRSVPQCYNCQRFGYSSPTCGALPRCVRCGVGHFTPDCELSVDSPEIKCMNCLGTHPANARICPRMASYLQDRERAAPYPRPPTGPSAPRPAGRSRQAQRPLSDPASFPVLPSVSAIPGFMPVTPVTQSSATPHLEVPPEGAFRH